MLLFDDHVKGKMMATNVLDGAARRAAKRAGLRLVKSRVRTISANNHGEYMLVEPRFNRCLAGERFDLSAESVIEWCRIEAAARQ